MEYENEFSFSTKLLEYFAARKLPYWYKIDPIDDHPPKIKNELLSMLASIPIAQIEEYKTNPQWSKVFKDDIAAGKLGRLKKEIVAKTIENEIILFRNSFLLNPKSGHRVKPYDHFSINDIPIDKDNLVNLSEFTITNKIIERQDYVYDLLPILQGVNSSYWLKSQIVSVRDNFDFRV